MNIVRFVFELRFCRSKTYSCFTKGVIPNIERRFNDTSDATRDRMENSVIEEPCHYCSGKIKK